MKREELIEEMAKVIARCHVYREHGDYHLTHEQWVTKWWDKYIPDATAALARLDALSLVVVEREPTREMLDAAIRADAGFSYSSDEFTTALYKAMLTASETMGDPA